MTLDVDAHKVGNLGERHGVRRAPEEQVPTRLLRRNEHQRQGCDVSLFVDKTDWADADYNAVLRELDRWLKAVLAETGSNWTPWRLRAAAPRSPGRTAC